MLNDVCVEAASLFARFVSLCSRGIKAKLMSVMTRCSLVSEHCRAEELKPMCLLLLLMLNVDLCLSPAGLSSFQESVAMDRIQRIMGVLQNPEMG